MNSWLRTSGPVAASKRSLSVCIAFLLLLIAGIAYQQYGLIRDSQKHKPPGRFVSLGDRRLHIHAAGRGQPTVVFESGLASSSLNWIPVQTAVSEGTCAISYDRAGIGWSDEVRDGRTIASIVSDLQALLGAAGHRPPYVLVGHSFGGLLARAYASLRREEVAGLVLVDPVSLDLWADCSAQNEKTAPAGCKTFKARSPAGEPRCCEICVGGFGFRQNSFTAER